MPGCAGCGCNSRPRSPALSAAACAFWASTFRSGCNPSRTRFLKRLASAGRFFCGFLHNTDIYRILHANPPEWLPMKKIFSAYLLLAALLGSAGCTRSEPEPFSQPSQRSAGLSVEEARAFFEDNALRLTRTDESAPGVFAVGSLVPDWEKTALSADRRLECVDVAALRTANSISCAAVPTVRCTKCGLTANC